MRIVRLTALLLATAAIGCTDSSLLQPSEGRPDGEPSAKIVPASENPPNCTSYLYDSSCGQPVTDFAYMAGGGALSQAAAELACRSWDVNCTPRNLTTTEYQWIQRQIAKYDTSSKPDCWRLAGTARLLLSGSRIRAYDNPYTLVSQSQPGPQGIEYTAGDTHGGDAISNEPLGIHIGAYGLPDATHPTPYRLSERQFTTVFMHEIVHAAFEEAIHDNGGLGQQLYTRLRNECG